jgi:hypothetical protein
MPKFNAKEIGNKLKIDWNKITLSQFRKGLAVELEHGTRDKKTDVTHNDPIKTGKIALAHLKEDPTYYTKLSIMEKKKK